MGEKMMKTLQMGKVSIIVPIYNVEKYIAGCIDSLLNQTYKNIEIILIDDGSKDNSIAIALNILENFDVTYTVIRQKNQGLSSARNAGIRCARGEYVVFIDADDRIDQDHIKMLVKCMRAMNLIFAFSDFECVTIENRRGSVIEKGNKIECLDKISASMLRKSFLKRSIRIHCCAAMFRYDFLMEHDLFFDERLKFGEDVEFLWRIITRIDMAGHVKVDTYKYLNRPGSLTNDQKDNFILNFIVIFRQSIHNQKLKPKTQDMVFERVVLGVLHSFAKHSDYASFSRIRRKVNQIGIFNKVNMAQRTIDVRWSMMHNMFRVCPLGFYVSSKVI